MTEAASICITRAYDTPEDSPGARLLVDRAWPRGIRREDLRLDDWIRDGAPSAALRIWFGHDPKNWQTFRRLYRAELDGQPDVVAPLLGWRSPGPVTLVCGARDRDHNQAVVLKEYLSEALDRGKGP